MHEELSASVFMTIAKNMSQHEGENHVRRKDKEKAVSITKIPLKSALQAFTNSFFHFTLSQAFGIWYLGSKYTTVLFVKQVFHLR